MNKKFCDGCGKELLIYNKINPDRYKILKLSQPSTAMQKDLTDGDYELCLECHSKIISLLKRKVVGLN